MKKASAANKAVKKAKSAVITAKNRAHLRNRIEDDTKRTGSRASSLYKDGLEHYSATGSARSKMASTARTAKEAREKVAAAKAKAKKAKAKAETIKKSRPKSTGGQMKRGRKK